VISDRYHNLKEIRMRPTKEMILETRDLINRTQRDIRQIIKDNDMELRSIRSKDDKLSGKNSRILFWMLFILSLILSFHIYRFLIS